ncbi:MAG: hypothetical protein FD143_2962 [Ignavibacteria bacterium]|nr:MAG: hypothetical protein FD143_2962 [Ignavibacteria bacterium]
MSSKLFCPECSNQLLDKCNACGQFLRTSNDEEVCETCKQPLSDEEESEDEYEIQKDGTKRAMCRYCNRKLSQCPKCEKEYDSDQDDESKSENESENESENSSEESETTTDESMDRNAVQSSDGYTGEGTDDEE